MSTNLIKLPFLVRKKFSIHGHDDTVTLGIFFFVDVHREINSTHDPVAKFFVDDFLDCPSVDVGDFEKAIDEGVFGDEFGIRSFKWEFGKGSRDIWAKIEEIGKFFRVIRDEAVLPQDNGGGKYIG